MEGKDLTEASGVQMCPPRLPAIRAAVCQLPQRACTEKAPQALPLRGARKMPPTTAQGGLGRPPIRADGLAGQLSLPRERWGVI